MLHLNGAQMVVTKFTRLDKIAQELPPNDTERFEGLPSMLSGLGGKTAPSGAGGMLGPQRHADQPVVSTRAPESRQEPVTDGGSFTATPPVNVRDKERQTSLYSRL